MATYVLVPGFWLGAWAWDEVAAHLRAAGHEVHALTLTGLAERAAEAAPGVDVDTHTADIVGHLAEHDLRDVVLVAHSGAALPVTGAADRVPERLARVVYVDTAALPSGWAQQDFLDDEQRAAQAASVGDGHTLPVPPFDPAADPVNLAGLTDEHLALIRKLATPEPYGAATRALVRPAEIPATPKTMICCSIPLEAVQGLIASGAPAFAALAAPEWTFHELPTGHWPMFSRPADLAELLARL